MRLAIELGETRLGTLEGDARTFDFVPFPGAIDRFGVNSPALSVSIPLAPSPRRDHAGRRRNWFAELLPEGDQYEHLLTLAGLRRGDTPSFLARYGRDVAGALQIWDLDDPTEPLIPSLRAVTDQEVRTLLEDPIRSPLANDTVLGRSSLGGVQPKIVLVATPTGWAQSLGGYPTTHLLKPQLPGANASVIYDEEYGSRIASSLGLAEFATSIHDFAGLPALVVERFDREDGRRLHQEDFNQVLGASGNEKYQEMGGVVSLRRIADALYRHATRRDLERLGRMVTLAVAIGNTDMHAKNLGLLHLDDGVRLAPAYDFVPQAHLTIDGRMALAVNGRYRLAELTREDLAAELGGWGLRAAADLVDETLEEAAVAIGRETPVAGAFTGLQESLAVATDRLRSARSPAARRLKSQAGSIWTK